MRLILKLAPWWRCNCARGRGEIRCQIWYGGSTGSGSSRRSSTRGQVLGFYDKLLRNCYGRSLNATNFFKIELSGPTKNFFKYLTT
jgi:hypothetical protein